MWSTQYMPRLIQTELAARKKLLILSTSFSILWLWNADLQSFNLLLTVFDNSGYLLLGNTGVLKVVYPLHPLKKTQGDVDITRPLGHVCCNICIWPSVQLVPHQLFPWEPQARFSCRVEDANWFHPNMNLSGLFVIFAFVRVLLQSSSY